MQYLPFIISLISGGLAGAVVNYFITWQKQRIDSSLRIIDYYFSIYSEIGQTKRILQTPSTLTATEEQIRVRKVGDWFELVASLCKKKLVDTHVLAQVALFSEMSVFRTLVEGTFNQSDALLDAHKWWPELYFANLKRLGD